MFKIYRYNLYIYKQEFIYNALWQYSWIELTEWMPLFYIPYFLAIFPMCSHTFSVCLWFSCSTFLCLTCSLFLTVSDRSCLSCVWHCHSATNAAWILSFTHYNTHTQKSLLIAMYHRHCQTHLWSVCSKNQLCFQWPV